MDDNDEFNHIGCSDVFAYNHQYFDEFESETCMSSGDNEIAIMEDNMFTNIEMNDGPEFFYVNFQKRIYKSLYGEDCIYTKNIESMVNLISTKYKQKFSKNLLNNMDIYNFWMANHLSHSGQRDMLKLIRRMTGRSSIPRSLNGVKQKIHRALSINKFGELHIVYPAGWKLDELSIPIDPIMVYLRDPIELISELFVNPLIMFKYKSQVKFKYYNNGLNDFSLIHADIMTSEWCKYTEKQILEKSNDGHILPLIFNSDGAQLGANINNKTTPLMCTTGNFSDDLIDQDIAKCVIGYLPNLRDYKASIYSHLKLIYKSEKCCNGAVTAV